MNFKDKINTMIKKSDVLSYIKLKWFKKKWRKANRHNFTTAGNCFNLSMVSVGNGTYGNITVKHFGNVQEQLRIGCYCSIGPECIFILGGEHNYFALSTYPFKAYYGKPLSEAPTKGPITIDDDVWLGYGVTVLSGVHIGQGAIIGAGAVVSKDVPPYVIMGGNPIQEIGYRFKPEIVNELLKIDFCKFKKSQIAKLMQFSEQDINIENVHEIVDQINKIIV